MCFFGDVAWCVSLLCFVGSFISLFVGGSVCWKLFGEWLCLTFVTADVVSSVLVSVAYLVHVFFGRRFLCTCVCYLYSFRVFLCTCVCYLYHFRVSLGGNGSAYYGSCGVIRGSFAEGAVPAEIFVRTWDGTERRRTEQEFSHVLFGHQEPVIQFLKNIFRLQF